MRLKKVQICEFRSIENMELAFDGSGHKILVGKNETGKSNILKALNLLSGDLFKLEDRKEWYKENPFVRFDFELDNNEIEKCMTKCLEMFHAGKNVKLTKGYTLTSFFEEHSRYISYDVQFGKNGTWTYPELDESLEIEGNWYRVKPNIANHRAREKFPSGSYTSEEYFEKQLTETERTVIRSCLSPIDLKDVYAFFREQVKAVVAPDNYIFPIRYWEYASMKHDLPPSIERAAFSQNPDSCIPVKNMFLLAGIQEKEIHGRISDAYRSGPNQIHNLFKRVSDKTNEYIKESWKEYKNVAIELRSDGENIAVGIRDSEDVFDFNQRSDGFRRLVSFLLMISTEIDIKHYRDTPLILIDEPETGLHPGSAKDLKCKLIKLGQKTTIVYATHSISMIDTDDVERNLIVSKDKGNTTYEEAKEDGTSPAENVYQAIGHSIYEDLKKNNILLEGYTDKRVFRLFMEGGAWEGFGIGYLGKGKNLETVTPLLDLASRNYFVLSDADEHGKRGKRDRGNPPYWYTYEDLGSEAVTVEDFYQKDFLKCIAKEIFEQYGFQMEPPILLEDNKRIEAIKSWLLGKPKEILAERAQTNELESTDQMVKKIIADIKIECAKVVTKENVNEGKIKNVLDALSKKIKDSQCSK